MLTVGWYHEGQYVYPDSEELVEGVLYQLHTKLREETDASNVKDPQIASIELTKAAAFAGKARAIAGPSPLHRALMPSTAIVFLAQSRKPE